ncbi:MAG: cytochrome c1 [Gammaproteobacteria bacterium]|nr:cytochrome c1 [Gammaproteobacteria bacterium]MDE2344850.1 cytochrome c1 [Gammaproteobacteria bacterium]
MKAIICAILLAVLPAVAVAQDEGVKMQSVNVDLSNTASLQRGAKFFVNYCMGCHSARYVRYNSVARDLGLTDTQLEYYLIFTAAKTTDTMVSSMPPADAEKWFGIVPPDLSLESRSRGADWIYTYLKSFYVDPSSKTGVNNTVYPKVSMPDVLWELQGTQKAVFSTVKNPDGSSYQVFDHFEPLTPGRLSPQQFDKLDRDLTSYLVYMGDPVMLKSRSLGLRVIGFLIIFFIIAYLLKREIWKKVH